MTTLTITIPKKTSGKQELVAIPRKEYEALLRARKQPRASAIVVKRSPSFRVAKKHEKFYDALDQELTETLRDVEAGNVYGPFDTADQAMKFLHRKR